MKHVWKFTLPTHIIGVASAVHVIRTEQYWFFAAAFIFWALLSVSVEVGVHRLFSHLAFTTHRWIELTLMYFATIAGQGSIPFWVAVHKGYHHPYSDTPKDPHSPVNGKFQAYIGWLIDDTQAKLSYRAAAPLLRDKAQKFFHEHYYKVIVATIVALLLIHPLLAGMYFLAAAVAIQANFAVNVCCHTPSLGYASYQTKDLSRNIRWLSPFSCGLSLHNNHHYDPGSYKLALNKGEFDIGEWVIRLIAITRKEPRQANHV